MIVCNDPRTGAGCGFHNPDGATTCQQCGATLKYAPTLHNIGDVIASSYRILSIIGHGGFGAVYAAEHTAQPGITYALKQSLDPASMQHFQREMQALQGIDHHNLPHYFDVFEDNNNAYLVMEFIPGQSLGEVLRRNTDPLPENVVLGYATQLCDALTYLHTLTPPVVHRDIKPDNIRITPEGQIKLVDFGLVKQIQGSQHQSTIRGGTPMYMAMEQMSGGSTPRTDLYGLGATLYHLLTGVPPVPVLDRLGGIAIQPPHQVNPRVSPHVSAAVMQAMELRPDDRPASARDLKRQLNQMTQPIPTPNVQRQTHDMTAQAAYQQPLPAVAPIYSQPPLAATPAPAVAPAATPQQAQQRGWLYPALAVAVVLLALLLGGAWYVLQSDAEQETVADTDTTNGGAGSGGGQSPDGAPVPGGASAPDNSGAAASEPTPEPTVDIAATSQAEGAQREEQARGTAVALEATSAALAAEQTAEALAATQQSLAATEAAPPPVVTVPEITLPQNDNVPRRPSGDPAFVVQNYYDYVNRNAVDAARSELSTCFLNNDPRSNYTEYSDFIVNTISSINVNRMYEDGSYIDFAWEGPCGLDPSSNTVATVYGEIVYNYSNGNSGPSTLVYVLVPNGSGGWAINNLITLSP